MKRAFILVTFLSLICACGDARKTAVANTENASTPAPRPEQDQTGLQKKFEEIAAASEGIVGAAALRFDTGETVSVNGDGRFPMQSVYKLPIALTVIRHIKDGKLTLERNETVEIDKQTMVGKNMHSPIRDKFPDGTTMAIDDVVRYAVSESDGTASDVLMKLVGGPNAVQEYLSSVGVVDMKVRNTEKEMGIDHTLQYENWATPLAAVKLLRTLEALIPTGESKESVLMKYLSETQTGKKRLKGKLPADAVVYHKTGTSWTENGVTAATNDIGIICFTNGKCAAVAVFVKDSEADESGREEAIANIAKAVWDAWSGN